MEFLNPAEILNQIELREDMIAADLGCGPGGWVIPLSKKLKEGKVYAIDVQPEVLSALKVRLDLEKIFNVKLIKADLEEKEGSTLQSNLLDLVLMTNLLFQVENKKAIIEESKRILMTGGCLLIVDWQPEASLGPKEGRVSANEAKEIAGELGLSLEKEFTAGPYHWALTFTKN